MKRDFLKNLGLEDDLIDKILDENSKDIGREKARTDQAKEELATAQRQLQEKDDTIKEMQTATDSGNDLQKQLEADFSAFAPDKHSFSTHPKANFFRHFFHHPIRKIHWFLRK